MNPTARILLTWAGIFVLSGLIALLVDEYVFPIWFDLGWERPVYDFLHSYAEKGAADEWSRVWMGLPFWVVAFLWGGVLGWIGKLRWLRWALVAGAGFFLIPQLWLLALDANPLVGAYVLRDLLVIPFMLGGAYLGKRQALRA